MVAWTVVFVLTLLVSLTVVTVSVKWTTTEYAPGISFLSGVRDGTPNDGSSMNLPQDRKCG
jgi:hypothetical protein